MANKSKGKHWVQVTDNEIIEALIKHKGITNTTAQELGIARQSLQARIKDNPALRKAQLEAREVGKDIAESKLMNAVENSEAWAITFFLKSQARDRGYGEQTDVNLNGSLNVNANIDLSVLSDDELKVLNGLVTKSTNEGTD